MNENEFELNGKTYVAVPRDKITCDGCEFCWNATCPENYGLPSCFAKLREDGRNVIFIEKDKTMNMKLIDGTRRSLRIMHTRIRLYRDSSRKVDDREDFKCAAEFVERAIDVLSKIIDRQEYVQKRNRKKVS